MEGNVLGTLAQLLPWFLEYGYVAIFAFMFLSEFYIPIPSNITLLAAGILSHVSQGGVHLNFFIAALVAFVASVAGDSLAYVVSRAFTSKKRREKLEKKNAGYRKVEKYLKKTPASHYYSNALYRLFESSGKYACRLFKTLFFMLHYRRYHWQRVMRTFVYGRRLYG